MSIKLAYTCDHCSKSFILSRKSQYINHLKSHANARMDEMFAKKLYNKSKIFEDRINSAISYVEIESIIKGMSASDMSSYMVPYKDMLSWRRDGRMDLYDYEIRGELKFIESKFFDHNSQIQFSIPDTVDSHILERLLPCNSYGAISVNFNILTLRIEEYRESEFIKKERTKFFTIRKLKS